LVIWSSNIAALEPSQPRTRKHGAPAGLGVFSAAHRVGGEVSWIDDAVEQLSNTMYTCSLDVVRDYPDGLSESSMGPAEHHGAGGQRGDRDLTD